jgi:hypothetical protein
MRLKNTDIINIVNAIDPFVTTAPAELRLYGSRVDDHKKGGDIDLLLIVPNHMQQPIKEIKHKILAAIKKNLGDRKIDLLICGFSSIEEDPFIAVIFAASQTIAVFPLPLAPAIK